MKGVKYLVDSKGEPQAVVIDLKKHGRLWEDFYDHMIVQSRKGQPRVSWQEAKAQLRRRANGK